MEEQQCQFLDHFFKQSAVRYPDAIAIRQVMKRFPYTGVDRLTNRFAHYLIEEGVGPEENAQKC